MTCLLVGAVAMSLASPTFDLRWTHSVERVDWVERWEVTATGLRLAEARVKGSGAGMEPGGGAVLHEGWWVWSPGTRVTELRLAASGATGAGWRLCDAVRCHDIGLVPGEPIVIAPCPPSG